MTQQPDPVEWARGYLWNQGQKSFEDLESLIAAAASSWDAALRDISEEQAAFHPTLPEDAPKPWSGEGPGWSVKATAGHYLVSERSLNDTVARLAGVSPPTADSPPPVREMGVRSDSYESLPLETLRQEFAGFFKETGALIGELKAAGDSAATFPHPVFGPLTAREWLVFHQMHTMDHVQQIAQIKTAPGYPA